MDSTLTKRRSRLEGLSKLSRLGLAVTLIGAIAVVAVGLTACTGQQAPKGPTVIRIGTLPTEDALPLFVAQRDGFAQKAGVKLELVTFPSAQERDAALVAGKIDGFMGDILAAATLTDKGTPVKIVSVMLGADPTEGRFGIAVPKGSPITQPMQLRGVPVAVSSNTITEYVVDNLLQAEGLSPADIKKVEIKKIPVRLQLLLAGKLKAAGLPDPLLAFAQTKGAKLVADDTKGQNLSQTVLVFRTDFLDRQRAAVAGLLAGLDEAAQAINAAPEGFRPLLVDKAKLPAELASSYRLNAYPEARLPLRTDVERALKWLAAKKLISGDVTYESLTEDLRGSR